MPLTRARAPLVVVTGPPRLLGNIGGVFAVRAFEALLTPTLRERWQRGLPGPDGDAHPAQPEFYVSLVFPSLLIDPAPIPRELVGNDHAQVAMWREWIPAHRAEWETLLPTGEGVDFSLTACRNGAPRSRQ